MKLSGDIMKNSDYFFLEITNWEKYQVRKDVNAMNFFRVQTSIFSDSKFIQLKPAAKLFFFYVLTECARANTKLVQVYDKVSADLIRVRTKSVQDSVSALEQLQMLRVVSRNVPVPREKERKIDKGTSYRIRKSDHSFRHPNSFSEFKNIFSEKTKSHWLARFKDEKWIEDELEKAWGFFYVTKSKDPSASFNGWTKRMNSWLERSWENNSKNQIKKNEIRDFGSGIAKL